MFGLENNAVRITNYYSVSICSERQIKIDLEQESSSTDSFFSVEENDSLRSCTQV